MNNILNKIPWIVIAILSIVLWFKGCSDDTIQPKNKITTVVDTVVIEKIIKVPPIVQTIYRDKFIPVNVEVVGNDTINRYSETYTDSTGIASVTVDDSINGKLLSQRVHINVKEQEVKTKEITITKTITEKLTPSFVLSGGLTNNLGSTPSTGLEITMKNRTGWNLDLGYTSNKNFIIGIKKDLITRYKK